MLKVIYLRAFAALTITVLLSLPSLAASDEEARLKVAEDLVSSTITSNFVTEMSNSTWPALESQLKAKNPDITQEVLEELKGVLVSQQSELIAKIVVDMPAIFAKYFTLEELEAIYEFQTSAVGQKALKVQPQIMAEFMPRMLQSIQSGMPQIMQTMQKVVKEKGYDI